jgi:hypothetical protein
VNSRDIRAICARHGITISVAPTVDDREHWEAVILDSTGEQPLEADGEQCWFTSYDTPHDAIAECLKARWGMTTGRGVFGMWGADNGVESRCADTELAAVVALADRLAGVRE